MIGSNSKKILLVLSIIIPTMTYGNSYKTRAGPTHKLLCVWRPMYMSVVGSFHASLQLKTYFSSVTYINELQSLLHYCINVYCFDTPLWTCIHCALHYLPSDIRSILQSVRTDSRIVYVRSTGPLRTLQAWRESQDSLWYVCSVLWCTLPSLKVRPCIFLSCFHVQGILKFFNVVR